MMHGHPGTRVRRRDQKYTQTSGLLMQKHEEVKEGVEIGLAPISTTTLKKPLIEELTPRIVLQQDPQPSKEIPAVAASVLKSDGHHTSPQRSPRRLGLPECTTENLDSHKQALEDFLVLNPSPTKRL